MRERVGSHAVAPGLRRSERWAWHAGSRLASIARMRRSLAVGVALMTCACAESDLEVRTRSAVPDRFPEEFAATQQADPPPQRPHSISLGYIGDAPLGTQPTPPHRDPSWTRPFPCHWTDTCWAVPTPVAAPYAVPDQAEPSSITLTNP